MPVILWSDALIFTLLMISIIALGFGVRSSLVREHWAKVYQHPSRMIALIWILFFTVIGLLDSMHYVPDGKSDYAITSVLDSLLVPISAEDEESYSRPFATHLFSKQMQTNQAGDIVWVDVKLKHVIPVAIFKQILSGFLDAFLLWSFATFILWFYFIRIRRINFRLSSPAVAAWLTIASILVIICICRKLIPYYHIFGTDKVGEDVFYASLKSIRTGLLIGTLTTMLTLPFAVLFGTMAGYYRGWVDDIIQYLYTTLSSIPGVLLIAAAMLSLDAAISRHADMFEFMAQRSDARLLLLCAIMGVTSWTSLCRILRAETLKLREQDFVLAAKVIGLNNLQIILKHIVPNLMHIILISLIMDFSGLVLAEAVLSYVGVGIDPTMFSWGNMINGARMEMGREPIIWWTLMGAFILMFILVLAANIFADGVREAFDPKVVKVQ